MRTLSIMALAALAAGCSSKADKERMNDAGPPPVTEVKGKQGLPAMKPPGEGGTPFTAPPKIR